MDCPALAGTVNAEPVVVDGAACAGTGGQGATVRRPVRRRSRLPAAAVPLECLPISPSVFFRCVGQAAVPDVGAKRPDRGPSAATGVLDIDEEQAIIDAEFQEALHTLDRGGSGRVAACDMVFAMQHFGERCSYSEALSLLGGLPLREGTEFSVNEAVAATTGHAGPVGRLDERAWDALMGPGPHWAQS